jgi:dihydrofolate reductase
VGTLSYTATVSLDGYAADANCEFAWAGPGGDLFRFHVERMEAVTAEVLGRRTYQLMTYWDAEPADGGWGADERAFARRWRDLDRVVVSSTLSGEDLTSERDRLLPSLPLDELREIVDDARGEVEIFGPTTAAPAILAGMVRDYRFFVVPRAVGGGLRALPDGASLDSYLVEHRVFAGGVVYLHYLRR